MAYVDRIKELKEFPAAAEAGKNERRSLGDEWGRILYGIGSLGFSAKQN